MNEEIVQVIGRRLDRRRSIATSGWSLIGRSFSRDRCRKWKRHESSFLRLTHRTPDIRSRFLSFSFSRRCPARLNENRDWSRCSGGNRSTGITKRVFGSQSPTSLQGTDTFFLFPFGSMGFVSRLCAGHVLRTSTLLLYRVKQTFITLIHPISRIYSRCTHIKFIVASIETRVQLLEFISFEK